MFFAFSHLNNCFGTCGHIQAMFNFYSKWYQHYHIAKALSIPKYIFKAEKQNRKLISYYDKVEETFFTSVKKAKILSFSGLKAVWTKNYDYKPWSKNLFNSVRLRSMQMLARPLRCLKGPNEKKHSAKGWASPF